jgi:hypothetical protein
MRRMRRRWRVVDSFEASGLIGVFDTEEDAERAGLDWARAYVDYQG